MVERQILWTALAAGNQRASVIQNICSVLEQNHFEPHILQNHFIFTKNKNIAEFHILVHTMCIYICVYTCFVQYIELYFLRTNGCSIPRKASCVAEVHTGNITALAVSYAIVTEVTVSDANPSIRCVDGLNSQVSF